MLNKNWISSILSLSLLISILSGCGAGGVDVQTTETGGAQAQLLSISITPADSSIAKDTSEQFSATGIYSDNTTKDLTESLTWTSSDTSVATIDEASLTAATTVYPRRIRANGRGRGRTIIKAYFGNLSGSTTLTVSDATLASMTITPTNPSIANGTAQQFTVTGTYSDNTTQDLTDSATWNSSNTGVASISASGLAASVAAGSATITATSGSISESTTLTVTPATLVSLAVTPANPSIAIRTSQQFTVTGTYSDNTTQDLTDSATWNSSNTGVASISASGLAASVAAGSTTITAASGSISGSTTLTVTSATLVSIAVTPTNPSIGKGTTQQFTATGTYSDNTTQNLTTAVTWNSSNTGVATVSNATGSKGRATAVAAGSATITAASGSVSGSTTLTVIPATLVSIAVTPTNPSIGKGTTQQFTATGTYSDNTTQNLTTAVTWNSSNTGVATVSNATGSKGRATAVAAGSATITAASGSVSGSTTLTVIPATLVSLAVTPANPSIGRGTTQQFAVTGTYSDNTTQNLTTAVTWSSSNTGVASISNATGSKGLATAAAAGSATITAASGSVSGSTTLTVIPATLVSLAVTPANPSIGKGTTQQFAVTGTYSDNTTQNLTTAVTWNSSNTGVATVSNVTGSKGRATAVAAGSATITATSGSISGSTTLTVTPATLTSIAVTPVNSTTASGTTRQFTATGTYSDGTTQNLTTTVTWSSSNTGIATISNATGSKGLAAAAVAGTATITAASGSVSATATLTVTAVITGSATLTWNAPTTNTDGTPLTDLAGYKIYYGTSSGNYTTVINIGNVTTYTVNNLSAGTYYFAVTSYDTSGYESSYSNEDSKTIQ